MRRPPKPFVTEYKNPSRRGAKDAPAKDSPTKEANARETVSRSSGTREGFAPENPWDAGGGDGGYEAALRAADALFSTKRTSDAPAKDGPGIGGSEHADAGLFPNVGARSAASDPNGGRVAEVSTEEGRGRILQAIEEPDDHLAVLEVERAPSRRGRKPGSKNKPKTVPLAASSSQEGGPQGRGSLEVGSLEVGSMAAGSLADDGIEVSADERPDQDAGVALQPPRAAVAIPMLFTGRRRARASWVRTTLKPGEKWKRRLPKVAW